MAASFEGMNSVTNINLKYLFAGQAEWQKKADAFNRLNNKMR